jgi:hypothetical protein
LPVTPAPPVTRNAPVEVDVDIVPLVMLAVAIFAPVRLPTLVILGCAAVVTVAAVVALVAAPVNEPTNVVLVTLVRPATVVTVAPSVSAVDPNVTAALANRA